MTRIKMVRARMYEDYSSQYMCLDVTLIFLLKDCSKVSNDLFLFNKIIRTKYEKLMLKI